MGSFIMSIVSYLLIRVVALSFVVGCWSSYSRLHIHNIVVKACV